MEFFEVLESRYSYKGRFLPDAVPLDKLELIAKAGLSAPTGNNSQCVKLIILPDKESLAPLCKVANSDGLNSAPAAIAIVTDHSRSVGKYNFEVEDYAAAMENMLLSSVALGYVSVWLDGPFLDEEPQKAACEALGIPAEGYHLRAVVPVGLPDGEGSRRTKLPFNERVGYGRF
jgi:Nitroreductase